MQFVTHELRDLYNECELEFPGKGAEIMLVMVLNKVADNLEEIADALNKEGGSDE